MSESVTMSLVDRVAACICWAHFETERDDGPYEYWLGVVPEIKDEYRRMARAALSADPRRVR